MINYRVYDLDSLLKSLTDSGVEILGEVTREDFGKFVHIRDPEGFRVELWEPNDTEYEKILEGVTN
jgi:predicted enzyme related to lactoylglutathione lyase